jgi:hypothetical protein
MITMTRRHMLVGAGAAGASLALPSLDAAAKLPSPTEDLSFQVYRDGSPIGHHRLDIRRDGDRVTVDVDILLEVGIGPLVLYRYRHRNTEIWEGGTFRSFSSETDDDGDAYAVEAVHDGNVIRVSRSHDSDYEISDPAGVLPTTYWNRQTVERPRLLDTQKGRLMDITVEERDWQRVETRNGTVRARRFDINGDLDLSLWYDEQGRWTKCAFPLKGSQFSYQLA